MSSLSDEERAERLEQAAALVYEVYRSLEHGSSACAHCDRTTYRNWDHYNKGVQLKAMKEKLDRLRKSFLSRAQEVVDANP